MSKELTIEEYMKSYRSLDNLTTQIVSNAIEDYVKKSNIVSNNYFRGYDEALKDVREEKLFAK